MATFNKQGQNVARKGRVAKFVSVGVLSLNGKNVNLNAVASKFVEAIGAVAMRTTVIVALAGVMFLVARSVGGF